MSKDIALLLLRVGFAGTMALSHGFGKLMGFSEISLRFPDPIGLGSTVSLALAVFSEFFCAIALVFGFFSRFAAFNLAFTMGVAFFVVHGQDAFNKKELAFVYLIAFLALLISGPGKISIDER
jgi:putative oxidoreductase